MKYSVVWLLCLLSSFPGYSCNLRMGIETSFPPYIVQQGDSWRGLNVELLQLLVQDIGCELEFIHSPWLRSLKLIEQGELDVLSHLTYNTERSAQFAFIGPHQLESIYLVGSAEAFAGLTDISQLRRQGSTGIIALLNGAYYGDELDSILNDANNRSLFVFIRGNEDKLALLLNGRVHGLLEDITAFHYWKQAATLPAEQYQPLFKVYESLVYFGFNRKTLTAAQLQQLAAAWYKRYQDGSLQRIVARYQLADYRFSLPQPGSLLPQAAAPD
ncbi:ABC transporter substrate-binding protein [Rheinheimera sp.]|uniref:substrate-binding periplasmic protein n=1 Tax=Rheinheimera sp. TaxID=1869214 RepID=UPI00273257E5|nr:transporter substrate-binding domain-containing protein [Rheinheimera sp.]MDP2715117.1 transporter substrate-binding domain-containing protein [Rheinheimera sp.]